MRSPGKPSGPPSDRLTAFVDGIEGKVARLLVAGQVLDVSSAQLPSGCREGDTLEVTLSKPRRAKKSPASLRRPPRPQLTGEDDGGDFSL